MKHRNKYLIIILLLISGISNAQIGIGTINPDPSSSFELKSTTQGFLPPRMTTDEQALISNPAVGLTIYNLTTSQLETNKGDGNGGPLWIGSSGSSGGSGSIIVATSATLATTNIDTDIVVSEMTLSPDAGTYLVSFNGEYNIDSSNVSSSITTPKAIADLSAAYSQLKFMTPTEIHSTVFGLGETLPPGVYDVNDSTIASTIILDGKNNSNSIFIIRVNGALSIGGATMMFLTNGAEARNVFWVAERAISIGANSKLKGNFISNGAAVSMESSCLLEGRLLSTGAGSVTINASTINIPLKNSIINLGVLSAFALFSASGAVGNGGVSFVSGYVGSDSGAVVGFTATSDCLIFTNSTPPYAIDNSIFATFSVYQNGILIPTSTRTIISKVYKTDVITLLSKAIITAGQAIDIRWNTNLGTLSLMNRSLTLTKM